MAASEKGKISYSHLLAVLPDLHISIGTTARWLLSRHSGRLPDRLHDWLHCWWNLDYSLFCGVKKSGEMLEHRTVSERWRKRWNELRHHSEQRKNEADGQCWILVERSGLMGPSKRSWCIDDKSVWGVPRKKRTWLKNKKNLNSQRLQWFLGCILGKTLA